MTLDPNTGEPEPVAPEPKPRTNGKYAVEPGFSSAAADAVVSIIAGLRDKVQAVIDFKEVEKCYDPEFLRELALESEVYAQTIKTKFKSAFGAAFDASLWKAKAKIRRQELSDEEARVRAAAAAKLDNRAPGNTCC
jgi:hypothetical protein